jgi:hypothetical protein
MTQRWTKASDFQEPLSLYLVPLDNLHPFTNRPDIFLQYTFSFKAKDPGS